MYAVERFEGKDCLLQGYVQEPADIPEFRVNEILLSFPYHNLWNTVGTVIIKRGADHEAWQGNCLRMRLRPI